MHLLVNMPRFPEVWNACGHVGTASFCDSFETVIEQQNGADAILVSTDVRLVYKLALATRTLRVRRPIFFIDSILRSPSGHFRDQMEHRMKRYLLGAVHHHIHYFRNLSGYRKHFGITPERSSYVPFRASAWPGDAQVERLPDGEYLFCFGWSKRDYETFFRLVEETGFAGAIVEPDLPQLHRHGSRFLRSLNQLPNNLQLLQHDRSQESQIALLAQAKLVILPILSSALCCAGISTYFNAMRCGKCVVLTDGPGVSDVLSDEACIVSPDNFEVLRDATVRLWNNDQERDYHSRRGYEYARRWGGERELYDRILGNVVRVITGAALPEFNRCF
jgi:glycosyltransferase involved in cell wall biosynthesis